MSESLGNIFRMYISWSFFLTFVLAIIFAPLLVLVIISIITFPFFAIEKLSSFIKTELNMSLLRAIGILLLFWVTYLMGRGLQNNELSLFSDDFLGLFLLFMIIFLSVFWTEITNNAFIKDITSRYKAIKQWYVKKSLLNRIIIFFSFYLPLLIIVALGSLLMIILLDLVL